MLLCNYRKCRQPLRLCAVATICKHIFCANHHPAQLKNPDGSIQCPVCRTRLKDGCEILEVDLQPCEQFRAMILMGQSPETIFDVCRRAVEFYNFQKSQETKYYEYINYKLTEKVKHIETSSKALLMTLENKNSRLQKEKDALIKECEELRDNLVVSSQKLTKLEAELNKLSVSKHSDCDQSKRSMDISHNHYNVRPISDARSDDSCRSKFPRCSPDSTYASPFAGRIGFPSINFRKHLAGINIFSQLRPTPSKEDGFATSGHSPNDSFRNISRISSKTFFH